MTKTGKNNRAKVVLVGAGPGDPALLTLKAVKYLQKAAVVVYDHLVNEQILTYCRPDAEIIYVGKKTGTHTLPQNEINDLLIEKAREQGLTVRLKGGDPFVFGRGGEEVLALHDAGIYFEVVPGITAGIAALSYAGIPATQRGDATSVSFITGHEDPTKPESGLNWPAIAGMQGTLIFYMGIKNLPVICQNLMKHGKTPDTPVALVRWGTLPRQQTITGRLDTIANLAREKAFQAPALIIVGEVVRYREKMNWFEKKPLFGKKIVITRARAQNSELDAHLRELGADVLQFPTIRIEPPRSQQPLDEAIDKISTFDWLLFTSVNGVQFFMERLQKKGRDCRHLHSVKIAAIGPATGERLRRFGMSPDLQPPKFVAESLLQEIKQHGSVTGKHFLLPRAEEARSILVDELKRAGAIVREITAYRTVKETGQRKNLVGKIRQGEIDMITFTSSSTVKNFVALIGERKIRNLPDVTVACIGPVTKQTAEDVGLHCDLMPAEYTIPGLLKEIVDYYRK